jgi:hypothetical protein
MNLFKQRKAKLVNGTIVREGDIVSFIGSDKDVIEGPIMRRPNGKLYFHNNSYEISDYPTLILVRTKK